MQIIGAGLLSFLDFVAILVIFVHLPRLAHWTLPEIAFRTMDAREVANSMTYGGNFLTQFPMSIYSVWMRRLFGYLIPLAFVNYYPALYLLGKADPTHSPVFLRFISPLVAVGSVAVAGGVWRLAVRRYRSTGP